ncbi:MAG TPA: hypothetical protein VI795_01970 [Patescibacteria group bacterium]|nr:hypothetical protein [Patescibacteria group bacterium]
MTKLQEFIKNKPYLIWYTKNYDNLSEKAIVESILNYGNWEDYLYLENILSIKRVNDIFKEISSQKRVNLRPQTVNYFSNYFKAYA